MEPGGWTRVGVVIGALILLGSTALVAWLWVQDSADPPPGSDLNPGLMVVVSGATCRRIGEIAQTATGATAVCLYKMYEPTPRWRESP